MPTPVEPNLPPDMLMMLGRMDGKLDNVKDMLTALTNKTEDHEKRLGLLEQSQGERRQQIKQFEKMGDDVEDLKSWRSEVEGGAKGIGLGWKVIAALGGGSIVGALGLLGMQAVQPHKQIVKAEQVIERSVSTSKH